MEHSVPYLLLTFFLCLDAFTLKHTKERLDYVEDRLNAESKLRREDFNVLFHKMESMETMLIKVVEKVDTKNDTTNVRSVERMETIPEEKIKHLLKAFEDEKVQNNRFRREITEEVNRQSEEIKNAYKNLQASLNNLAELLKEEDRNMENTIRNDIEKVNQKLDLTIESDENISQNLTDVRSILEEHSDTVTSMQNIAKDHFQSTQEIGLNVTQILNTIAKLEMKCTYTTETQRKKETKKYTSCLDLYENGFRSSGTYDIFIPAGSETATDVYCDMTTDNGGWTVFQRRQDGSVDFYRDWNDYKTGFGDLTGEFWLGNEYLHILTNFEEPHELRIELEDYEGFRAYAKYGTFNIGAESTNYTLKVSGYTGNAGDSLEKPDYMTNDRSHDGMSFTTKDRDNDKYSSNCAATWQGAWWYNVCFVSNLNGLYGQATCSGTHKQCLVWFSWNNWKSLKFTEMKLR